jgi:RNA polymerase sigma factor (TIGR02999 family)
MPDLSRDDPSLLLEPARQGDRQAAARLLPLVYDQLRRVAARFLDAERAGHTLQPTALVHEAYLKLIDQSRADWQGRTHFIAVAAEAMRRILVDHARARLAQKRGGGAHQRVTLHDALSIVVAPEIDVLALDAALTRLASLNERHARIVELRFFGGLTVPEVAASLGIAPTTVEKSWAVSRAWLRAELSKEQTP